MTMTYARLDDIPLFNQDVFDAGIPEPARRLRAEVTAADGVLIASPEYNFSLSAALKNAIDWASRPLATNPLRNKPVAVVGGSTGAFGAVWAQAELRKVLATTGARVVEGEIAVGHAPTRFDEDGRLVDENLLEELQEVISMLVAEATARCEAEGPHLVTAA
jgi:chromate reductase